MAQYCYNSSDCFNGGECKHDNVAKYNTCLCKTYFDSSTSCNTTIFEQYGGLDLIYPGIGIPLHLVLLGLYVLEFGMDVIRRKISPILLTKGVLVLFIISRIASMSLWIVSSTNQTTRYARHASLTDSFGTLCLITADVLVIVSWLDLVLKAKHLGQVDNTMLKVKRGLFIAISLLFGANIIALVANEINPRSGIFLAITVIVLMLTTIAAIIISAVYLVRIRSWLKDSSESKTVAIIRRKSKWIIVLLLMLLNIVFFLAVFFVIRRNSPVVYLAVDIVSCSVSFITVIIMLLFLENSLTHLFKKGSLNILSSTTVSTPAVSGNISSSKPGSSTSSTLSMQQ